MAQKLMKTA